MEKSKSIGALWSQVSKNGMNYFSGEIELNGQKTKIVVFPNDKKADKQPDFRIMLSKPNPNQGTKTEDWHGPVAMPVDDSGINVADIPF